MTLVLSCPIPDGIIWDDEQIKKLAIAELRRLEKPLELYALQKSNNRDRLFRHLDTARNEAESLVEISSDDYKIYSPDNKYYFYAKNIRTHGHIKICKVEVED